MATNWDIQAKTYGSNSLPDWDDIILDWENIHYLWNDENITWVFDGKATARDNG